MAQKDDSVPTGLLSRVVRFVRNPSSGFTDVRWRLFFGGVCALHVGTRSG